MNSRGARRWWALAAITLGVLAVGLDVTVLSVALPTLAVALKASESDLQWFSSGYALTLAAGMLPAGVLGDRFGRKRILLGALVLFGAGSVACAFAVNSAQFIAGRLILGVAGAAIVVMALSVMTVIFTEEERPRAVGIWAAANFLALPIGPIFGGWLLTNFWWGWIFLMNVPVAAIGLLAVLTLVPESRASQRPGLDPQGSGVRLLPIIVGLIFGAVPADRVADRVGPKVTVATGFAITLAGLLLGSTTAVDSSPWFIVAWMMLVGFGMGMGFATAAAAALKTVPSEQSGVASALVQAMQKVGAPFGSAILGSVLVTVYRSQLTLTGLPPAVADAVRRSLFAGVAVAEKMHSPALLVSVRHAFVQGMDAALVVSAVVAAIATLLALVFLPGRTSRAAHVDSSSVENVA